MEDYRNEIMIIFGTLKEMEQFFWNKSWLKSVPNTFFFEDYSGDEIVEMGLKNLRKICISTWRCNLLWYEG